MRRILYISNYKKGVGGISAQVDMLCSFVKNERVGEIESEGFETDIFSTKGNPLKRITLFFKLLCAAKRFDVLHIHGCSDFGMMPVVYGVIAGKIWRKKIIITYHGGEAAEYFTRHGAFARRWLCRVDQVIVLSGFLKKVFDEYQIPCVVIPNIVTLHEDIYQPKHAIAPKLISIRHLTSTYRIDLIIRALEQVVKQYPEATLDILGQGDKREELEQYVHNAVESGRLKVGSVRFLGQVPNEKIYDYLRTNDIMLSAPKIDNMPVSVLEAMNAGLLVISSNVGGIPYMIEHQRTGLLFEKGNVDVIAAQIKWALTHQEECLKMIAAAHEEVKRYSWENIRKQLLPLYELV